MSKANLPRLSLAAASELLLRKHVDKDIVPAYVLGQLVFKMFADGAVDGRQLRIAPRAAQATDYYAVRTHLLAKELLVVDSSLPNTILLRVTKERPDAAEVMCVADPFGFVSHLSAMTFHGLSNRIPKVLYFTTLSSTNWQRFALERMRRDLGKAYDDYLAQNLPLLRRPQIHRFHGVAINYVHTQQVAGAFRLTREDHVRVSTIGRTFLDMLQRPDLSGGMSHVVEVFETHAEANLPLILSELEAHGSKIDRVRAGYLLEERCNIRHPQIDTWVKDAQRGGSRKLDPQSPYEATFSDRWMISINA